jgi:plastocyanin
MARFSVLSFVVACVVSSAAGASFQVQVGENATLTFDPETIIAQPGDTVTYNFHPKVSSESDPSSIRASINLNRIIR